MCKGGLLCGAVFFVDSWFLPAANGCRGGCRRRPGILGKEGQASSKPPLGLEDLDDSLTSFAEDLVNVSRYSELKVLPQLCWLLLNPPLGQQTGMRLCNAGCNRGGRGFLVLVGAVCVLV